MNVGYLKCEDGSTLAYQKIPGRSPGILFLGGFRSDMLGTKASYLANVCREKGQAFLCFDYAGHGLSSGHFTENTIGDWKQNALTVFDQLTEGSQILIGSSMGGWLMFLLARERMNRLQGLVGIAAAPDFTSDIKDTLSEEHRKSLDTLGVCYMQNEWDGEMYPISQKFLNDGHQHHILSQPLTLSCPLRLLHGTRDEVVSWQKSLKLLECIESDDAHLTLIKEGDHRLSNELQLRLIAKTAFDLIV